MLNKLKVLILFFILTTSLTYAETIYLKDGTILNGAILMQDRDVVKISTSYGEISVQKFNIESISYTASSQQKKDLDDAKSKDINININNTPQIFMPTISVQQQVNIESGVEKDKKSIIKIGVGAGAPYGVVGAFAGLMINKYLEISFAGGIADDYQTPNSVYGIKYFYDTPYSGAYLGLNYGTVWLMSKKLQANNYLANYCFIKGATVGLGYEFHFGNLMMDISALYLYITEPLPSGVDNVANGLSGSFGIGLAF